MQEDLLDVLRKIEGKLVTSDQLSIEMRELARLIRGNGEDGLVTKMALLKASVDQIHLRTSDEALAKTIDARARVIAAGMMRDQSDRGWKKASWWLERALAIALFAAAVLWK